MDRKLNEEVYDIVTVKAPTELLDGNVSAKVFLMAPAGNAGVLEVVASDGTNNFYFIDNTSRLRAQVGENFSNSHPFINFSSNTATPFLANAANDYA